jgi:hypothetical protein
MALEYYLEIKTPNSKVTVIGSNPTKRELILGFEDGSVQTFDHETGQFYFKDFSLRSFCFVQVILFNIVINIEDG